MKTEQSTPIVAYFIGKRLNFIKRINLLWIFFFFALPLAFAQIPANSGNTLLILQANTHGNSNNEATGSGFPRSAVELFNNGEQAVDLSAEGYYLHIGGAAGWLHSVELQGIIPPGHSFLIVSNNSGSVNATPRAVLPTADLYYNFVIPNEVFTIALMRTATLPPLAEGNIWVTSNLPEYYGDMLGIGAAALGFETAPFTNQSRPRIPRRSSLIDTDNNSADFTDIDTRNGALTETRQRPNNDVLYRFWPRNSQMGAWNPMTGIPRIDPVPSPHIDPDPGNPDCENPINITDRDPLAGKLLILQAFGAADNRAGSHSFVELFNASDSEIELDGITLFHATGAGAWSAIPLNGTLPAQTSFLVLGARTSTVHPTAPLQIVDDSGDINVNFTLNNRAFRLVLFRGKTDLTVENPFTMDGDCGEENDGLIDFVGSRNADADPLLGYIGSPTRNSNSEGIRRVSLDASSNNSTDFTAARYGILNEDELSVIRPKNVVYGAWNPFPKEVNQIEAGEEDDLAGKLFILQAYGSASDANGTTHSFVELYNTTDASINLSGITLFHADGIRGLAAREAGVDGEWRAIPLNGTIPPKTSFLVLGSRQNLNEPNGVGSGNAPRFAIAENSGDINDPNFTLSNRAFKVALIRSTKDLTVQNPFTMNGAGIAEGYIDMVGSANDINHTTNPDNIFGFETAPTRNSASQSARRKNLVDTDDNAYDFENIDFRAWSASNPTRTTDEELEIFRPKNRTFGPWNPFTGEQIEPGDPNGNAQAITSFRFSYQNLGWGETDDYLHGTISENGRTITFTTQRWIENINRLPAIFELDDDGIARVNGISQWSGITQNDFRRDVVYTVGENEYTVIFISPQATGLPVININTYGAEIHGSDTEIWTTMTFSLSDPNNPKNDIATISNQQIRGRGNSTWHWYPEKRPYRVRFRDDTSLFERAARRNWVLLAEYRDPTFLVTMSAFRLGYEVFEMRYAPSYQHVHLVLNDEYQGLYLLVEHRQADPRGEGVRGRPQICPNAGWFVDFNLGGHPGFWVDLPLGEDHPAADTGRTRIRIMSPEFSGDINDERYRFVINDWNAFVDSLNHPAFPESGYRDLIDMDAFVDQLLVRWITADSDFRYPNNIYIFKDASGAISTGPIWDFDSGFGWRPPGFGVSILPQFSPGMFNLFLNDPVFLVRVKERWNEKFDEIATFTDFMHPFGETIRSAIMQDYIRHSDSQFYRENFDLTYEINLLVNWWYPQVLRLDARISPVEVLPTSKNFGTIHYDDYPEMILSPQIFTLVAYGEMSNLSAVLRRGDSSDFEISTELTQTPTGNGGYLATMSVKLKDSLSEARHTDVLVLSGNNQGNPFLIEVPLTFEIASSVDEIFTNPLRAWTNNEILYINGLTAGETLSVFTVAGTMIYHNNVISDTMEIPLNVRGVYIIRSGNNTLKVIN